MADEQTTDMTDDGEQTELFENSPDATVESGSESEAASASESVASATDPSAELQRQLEAERIERARLEARIEERDRIAAASQSAQPAKEHSWGDYRAAIDNGQISESDAHDQYWAQRENRLKRELRTEQETRDTERARTNEVERLQAEHVAERPDLLRTGSDDWNRANEAFERLIRLGDSREDPATQVKAMEMAFGTPGRGKEHTSRLRQTSSETSGGSRAAPSTSNPVTAVFDKIPPRMRDYYRKKMENGYSLENIKKDISYMDIAQ